MRIVASSLCILLASFIGSLHADNALLQQADTRIFIEQLIKHDQFNRQDVVNALKQAQYQPKIVELMERPYEKKDWDIYRDLFLTQERVNEGLVFWKENQSILAAVEKQYGVPAEIIVAILGVETRYGKRQGDYRVLDALATLAFYYPKRSAYFSKELREYFLLCREHHVPITTYIGSYAGAIGQPQFMPSNYREYAIDYTSKGHRDLINNKQDVIASVANFFKEHGWQTGQMITTQAQITGWRYRKINTNTKQVAYAVKQLAREGVRPLNGGNKTPNYAGLIELPTAKGPEYWLAYPNFYAITRYNSSPQYALAVYLLSQQIKAQRTAA